MTSSAVIAELETNGPERCESMSPAAARERARRLAESHYENFSVLSRFVPEDRRDDFAAIYAFCRWADDLGDEAGDRERASELLAWWREELQRCFAGQPRHPVFVALRPTIERHDLPIKPFDDLISAFEMDQTTSRYETWNELLGYCRLSADPVGRLVLMTLGEPRTKEFFDRSDAICTALQLTNHWQDVKRDLLERDRIYLPSEMHSISDFEIRMKRSAVLGHAPDREFLGQFRAALRTCVSRTWDLYEKGIPLIDHLRPTHRPIIWLFAAGGTHILRRIEMWNCETVLHRPRLSRLAKATLVLRAWWKWKRSGHAAPPADVRQMPVRWER